MNGICYNATSTACRSWRLNRNPGKIDIFRWWDHYYGVNKVEQVESELRKLSPAELRRVRDWLDDFVEDQMDFTPEFEAAIRQSESEMKSGVRPRVRRA
jgi:hypothetical protein